MAENIADEGKKINAYDPKRVEMIIADIEGYHDELDSLKGEHMNRCRSVRESIATKYEEAKAYGMNKKALKTVIKKRELERKLETVSEDLEGDQVDSYEQILQSLGGLGDLPLGGAAKQPGFKSEAGVTGKPAKAAKINDGPPPPDDLRTAAQRESDHVADNVTRLNAGIKETPAVKH